MNAPIKLPPDPSEMRHVFEIAWDVWTALDDEEIAATVDGMREMGIYELPYVSGNIIIRIHLPAKNGQIFHEVSGIRDGEEFKEQIIVYPDAPPHALAWYKQNPAKAAHPDGDPLVDMGITIEKKRIVHRFGTLFSPEQSRKMYRDGLVVMLASRGLAKNSKQRKLAKLGIGKKDNEYVTTIRMERDLERHESIREGSPVRPHLRRGHVRMQPHGHANSLRKKIWVEPCFVNADADFVNQRKAYRVRH